MEKLIIKDFLIFKDIDLTINKFNILIGPQASGKSLLAKLVYFFRNISILMRRSFENGKRFEGFIENLEEEFLEFFPVQYWSGKNSFTIKYVNNDININIKSDFRKNLKTIISFSSNIEVFYSEMSRVVIEAKKSFLLQEDFTGEIEALSNNQEEINVAIRKFISDSEYSEYFNDSIFIPASRSFFSTLNKNIWTLTDQDIIDVDPFVSRFGRAYEQSKLLYSFVKEHGDSFGESVFQGYAKNLDYISQIIKGEYVNLDDKDWIQGDDYKVSLSRASSGQQESLPMLMVLIFNATRKNRGAKQFFIEEPEAHLFPDAQNNIVSLLLNLKEVNDVNFFITTHSPYVLSALNNSIYASELIKKEKLTVADYLSISADAYPLDFNDISAYSLKEGKLIDIKDPEFNMIGGDILDNVSNEFGEVMDKLMGFDD